MNSNSVRNVIKVCKTYMFINRNRTLSFIGQSYFRRSRVGGYLNDHISFIVNTKCKGRPLLRISSVEIIPEVYCEWQSVSWVDITDFIVFRLPQDSCSVKRRCGGGG